MKIISIILLILASSSIMAEGVIIEDFTFDNVEVQSESQYVLPESTPTKSDEYSEDFLRGLKAGLERGRTEGRYDCRLGR